MDYIKKRVIGDATLYLADSMKLLPHLKDTADCIVSDPPYRLESGGGNDKDGLHTRMGKNLNYSNSGAIVTCDIDWPDFIPLMYDSLKDDNHAYIMCNNRHVVNLGNSAESAGFRFHNWLVWNKGSATPNRWYMKNLEYIGFFFKGKAKYINDMSCKQLMTCPQIDYSEHPTEKPVSLMQYYIENSTQKGDMVLDPFMGSGSTGVACVKSGRKFMGIEIESRWFDVSCARIEEATKQGNLF